MKKNQIQLSHSDPLINGPLLEMSENAFSILPSWEIFPSPVYFLYFFALQVVAHENERVVVVGCSAGGVIVAPDDDILKILEYL